MDLTTGNAALSVASTDAATRSGTEAAKMKSSLSAFTSVALLPAFVPPVASHRGRRYNSVRTAFAALLILAVGFVTGCNRTDLLVGNWQGTNRNGDKWTVDRRADNTFTLVMTNGGNVVTAEGVYGVIGWTHRYYYTSSSDPSWKIKHEWKEKVVQLTSTEFQTKDKSDGLESFERKVGK